jgi:hypothetical protein
MIRIAISQAAFDAIASTLALGSMNFENKTDEHGQRLIWPDRAVVDRLRAIRDRGELERHNHADRGGGRAESMVDRYNEGKALDAVLRFIEARDIARRKDDGRSPTTPRTQTRTRCGESTTSALSGNCFMRSSTPVSSPFPNQIRLSDHNQKLLHPIIKRFDHRTNQTKREVWDFYVPVEASATVNDVSLVQCALIKWIDANWTRIPVAPRYGRHASALLGESVSEIPFPFSLHRTISPVDDSALCGRFFLSAVAPDNLEQQRAARLQTACERKSPKLAKWKQDSGARTVLILEEDDLWSTNHFRVADALVPAEATTPDAPDEVFLVSTGLVKTWWVISLRGTGMIDGEPNPHSEFDPKELKKLTWR